MKEQVKTFENQLALITDEKVREFTIKALETLPDYFWTMPASTTGKYHPASSLGEGGVVRHTKTALKIAEVLFRLTILGDYNDLQKDCISSAIMLHDGCKCGLKGSKFTVHEHPMVMAQHVRDNAEVYGILKPAIADAILKGIESHMANWTTNDKSKVVLPSPEKPYQVFIALCDYLSAQKIFHVEVEGWEDPNVLTTGDKEILKIMAEQYVPAGEFECGKFEEFMKKVEGGTE